MDRKKETAVNKLPRWLVFGACVDAIVVLFALLGQARNRAMISDLLNHKEVQHTHPRRVPRTVATPSFYTSSDLTRFASTSENFYFQSEQLPRVLLYSTTDINTARLSPLYVGRHPPSVVSGVYWKACYAHLHGFNLAFASGKSIEQDAHAKQHNDPRTDETGNRRLQHERDDSLFWTIMEDLNRRLSSGLYDYVFWLDGYTAFNDLYLDLPVWAYDLGHDITVMDQIHNPEGFQLNGVLFRTSPAAKNFMQGVLGYKNLIETYVSNGQGAFLEMMLTALGAEAEERGTRGYSHNCAQYSRLGYMAMFDENYVKTLNAHSECFFAELERLAGAYGYRESKTIGFSKTYTWQNKLLLYHDVANQANPGKLLPLSNCVGGLRTAEHAQEDCFVYNMNDGGRGPPNPRYPSCPDHLFRFSQWYGGNDWLWFRDWSQRSKHEGPPRVLIYTWAQESSFQKNVHEIYWKSCYAHVHSFDIVFSDVMNVSGLKKTLLSIDSSAQWYSDEMVWARYADIGRFLFSGKYDYVLVMDAETLVNDVALDFPAWAYDTGHDITFMDADYGDTAFIQHAVLFKPTSFTKTFLDHLYAYRSDYWTLGDGGPLMETILAHLGKEAESAGLPGYQKKCENHSRISMPSAVMVNHLNPALHEEKVRKHSTCFFSELSRLAGGYGSRVSKHIGFTPVFKLVNGKEFLPDVADISSSVRVLPWASCIPYTQNHWARWGENCLTWTGVVHLKGDPKGCPDPTFNWNSYPWNAQNRGR